MTNTGIALDTGLKEQSQIIGISTNHSANNYKQMSNRSLQPDYSHDQLVLFLTNTSAIFTKCHCPVTSWLSSSNLESQWLVEPYDGKAPSSFMTAAFLISTTRTVIKPDIMTSSLICALVSAHTNCGGVFPSAWK